MSDVAHSDVTKTGTIHRSTSVGAMFAHQVAQNPRREAYRYPEGDRWISLTWSETADRVHPLAAGLLSLGVQTEDRVGIASSCRIEWVLADHAIMCAGGATTTVYPTTQHDEVSYILSDSGCKIVFAEDQGQVDKILAHAADLPDLIKIVIMDGAAGDDTVITLDDLIAAGRTHLAEHPDCVTEAVAATHKDSLATLIYTSGTTGLPKGVRLVHDNWLFEGEAIDELGILDIDDLQYLWLPLSHVFGKCLIAVQLQIGFATAVDGRMDKIVEGLGVVQPTFMAGAPRIFEKVRARVKMSATTRIKATIFDWAFGVGAKVVPVRLSGAEPSGLLAVQNKIATLLVFSKVTARLGGRIRFLVSGSAALSREVQEWFYAADLTILEGYGLTETGAASCINLPWAPKFGTVGPPVPGLEVRIAEDGEVLLRGRGVMRGYHNRPEETAAAIDAEGWFRTGDIGELIDGRLRITDRKKDLIKTSGGKYVAPQKVEGMVKAATPYLSQVLVHGDGRKFVSALFELDPEVIDEWAQANGMGSSSYADLAAAPEVRALVQTAVDEANGKLERWETIKEFAFLPEPLTVDAGDITPSLKVRRKAVEKRYADLLDGLYPKD